MRFLFLFIFLCELILAQQPNTDIWLFPLKTEKNYLQLKPGMNVTNRIGYDNQPSWSNDNKQIYFVSVKEDKQSDVYFYDLGKKKIIQLTKTVESEYSPTLIDNGKKVACVVVEKDSAQRIWTYDALTGSMQQPLLNEDSVGYFTILNKDTVLYYKLTNPHSLRAHQLSTKKDVWLTNSPVRGFKKINAYTFVYGTKDSSAVKFYQYDARIQKANPLCVYPSLAEDISWHPTLGLLKSEEATILKWDTTQQKWVVLLDFKPFGIEKITRFIFDSKTKNIVVVNNLK
jgi:hypothetical protein